MAPTPSKRSKPAQDALLPSASTENFFKIEDKLADSAATPDGEMRRAEQLLSSIRTMVTNNTANWRKQDQRDAMLTAIVQLRRLNRLSNFRGRLERAKLADARQRVEEHHLTLQNVTNEIGHLRKNIDVCLEFQPADSDIPLVPVEEFNAHAPAGAATEEAKADPHQLHMARLNYELSERKSMAANLQELEGRKSALLSDIRGKEQRLAQVRSRIVAIKKCAVPLLDALGLKERHLAQQQQPRGDGSAQMIDMHLGVLRTNEEVCREIFGAQPVELGADGRVVRRLERDEEVSPMDEGNNVGEEKEATEHAKKMHCEEPLSSTNLKTFFALDDALAANVDAHQCCANAIDSIGEIRCLVGMDRVDSSALLFKAIALRRLNRLLNVRASAKRVQLEAGKAAAERKTTELRECQANMDYLRRCVELCLEQQSVSEAEGIDLVPVEQFLAEALPSVSRPEDIDAHRLHLARLRHELSTRKSLLEQVRDVEQRKKGAQETVAEMEKVLVRVQPRTEQLKKAAKPLLDIVGLKSVALAVHNMELPFRPVPVSADTYREMFVANADGGTANADGVAEEMLQAEDQEEELMMELDEEI